MTQASGSHLLDVRDLRTQFLTHEGTVRAVDGVSFHLDEGEVLGSRGGERVRKERLRPVGAEAHS